MTELIPAATEAYRSGGEFTEVYLDVSVDTSDPPQVKGERRTSLIDTLTRDGAPQENIDRVLEILETENHVPSPVTVFALVKDGSAVIHELLPGIPIGGEIVSHGPVPNLVPLLKQQPDALHYAVVETARDGGEVRLYRAGSFGQEVEEHVQGRTDSLHKPREGGWSNDRYQDHVEEIWRRTQAELADTVNEVVRTHRPRLLIVAGDIRARQLLQGELSEQSLAILSLVPTDTRADGASDDALVEHIDKAIEELLEAEKKRVVDLVNLHGGRGDNEMADNVGEVVHALASAQVDTLLIDTDALGDRTLLALDAEPWIASAPEDALGASVLASVPAAVALLRAALLTDAHVLFTDSVTAPDGADAVTLPTDSGVVALLRWRTGPGVPGVSAEQTPANEAGAGTGGATGSAATS